MGCFGFSLKKKGPKSAHDTSRPAGAWQNDKEYVDSITYGYTSSGIPKRRGRYRGGPSNPNALGGHEHSMNGGLFGYGGGIA